MTAFFQRDRVTLYQGDCLDVMSAMPDNSIDLIIADPPYFKVKSESWDRQWDKPAQFLAWLDSVAAQWQRILKPNGSLYCFASPKMAAKVECKLGDRFNVLNRITWRKPPFATKAEMFRKEDLRTFFPASEAIIFCEHHGADNIAKGEAGYEAKCDELRGFVFEPLRAYLDGERERAGVSVRQVAEAFQKKSGSRTVTGMAGHWFGRVQWALPTEENYLWLRSTLASLNHDGAYLRREYEDLRREYEDLRREYEDLRREYEDLRRPFSVSADVPYTDVWDFPTVSHYPGKHPCEKPMAMIRHMVKASGKSGCVVLDPFAGSGVTLEAARDEGFEAIGIEKDDGYCKKMAERLDSSPLFSLSAAG